MNLDLLCVGVACYDLTFAVAEHPLPDGKSRATALASCGGGLAANAAVAAAKLGYRVGLLAQLGDDLFGDEHVQELAIAGVSTDFVVRYAGATKLSVILAKGDGTRSVIHYAGKQRPLPPTIFNLTHLHPKVILLDGHELPVAERLCQHAHDKGILTVLDADTAKPGTVALVPKVDYVVCSQRFAWDFTGEGVMERALEKMTAVAPNIIITLGTKGLIWHHDGENGTMPAFPVEVVDSTGAGDAFHGAFAACLAAGKSWQKTLQIASAVAALCCTKVGARIGIPSQTETTQFLRQRGMDL